MVFPVVAVLQHKDVKVGAVPGLKEEPDSPKDRICVKNKRLPFWDSPYVSPSNERKRTSGSMKSRYSRAGPLRGSRIFVHARDLPRPARFSQRIRRVRLSLTISGEVDGRDVACNVSTFPLGRGGNAQAVV